MEKILDHLLGPMATYSPTLGISLYFIMTKPNCQCQSTYLKINDIIAI